ncbi:lipid-A-disaccharide synthase [Candidatus Poribacteria bacterium]|nr:lipid-A-disaccharide synthase [Candidatus Poribacteria bacterium]
MDLYIGKLKLKNIPCVVGTISDKNILTLNKDTIKNIDILELRVDMFKEISTDYITQQFNLTKTHFDKPIIATIRDVSEGGCQEITDERKCELYKLIMPYCDAIDIEVNSNELLKSVIPVYKKNNKIIICSYHNFKITPDENYLTEIISKAKKYNADITKIAVMANKKEDVSKIISFTIKNKDINLVTISLGNIGLITRIINPILGSLLTYGFIGVPSAPGQIPALDIVDYLKKFDKDSMNKLKLFIITGEDSGELHGTRLVENILQLSPGTHISGIGSAKLKDAGVDIFFDRKSMAIMGITEIFGKIKFLKDLLKKIENKFRTDPPHAVILIDYPGFNLKVAKIAHELNIPVIYYITPQIWAWAPKRIKKIAAWVSKAIVIFDFEKELYQKAGVPVEFVGHPLLDIIHAETDKKTALKYFDMEDSKRIVTLMPGSRASEIKAHMPILLKTAKLILERLPQTKFIIPCADGIDIETIGRPVKISELPIRVIKGKTYDVINVSDFIIVASGTATLEAACFEKPMVIIYKTSVINWILGKIFMIIPFFGLVNILAKKEIVPEYLQIEINPEIIADYIFSVLTNNEKYLKIQNDLREIKNKLGEPGVSKRAAEIVLKTIKADSSLHSE